jgi:3',5'-cyclic AMP phosphodiesterase CpdA
MTGGDNIYDAFGADAQRTGQLWDLWNRQLRDHCSLPVEHCIGNRDIWGWDRVKSKTIGTEKRWGKAWALEALGLDHSYRSLDRGPWHIVVLDSVAPDTDASNPEGFQARLDEQQFEWLADDLSKHAQKHTLIVSHVPIVCACVYLDDEYEKTGNWVVPRAWMHIDARRLVDLFARHRQVKACLSGHIHQVDRIDYQGVSYFCNGAVCGNWWKGPNRQCESGYAIVDLFDDGSVECQYTTFDWSYPKE